MADTKVLIVVNDLEAGDAYTQVLTRIGVAYDLVPSFHQMAEMATQNAYNGLIIDILALIRCSKEEKVIAYDCINIYPVLRVKWEGKQKKIKLNPLDQGPSSDAESALKLFIEARCRSFPARLLRRDKRKQIHLNVLFSPDGTFSDRNTTRTFTVSISRGGLFLHTMQSFENGETVWLRFIDFADQTPIAATVRWSLAWGKERSIPGIGLRFEAVSMDQEREIQALC